MGGCAWACYKDVALCAERVGWLESEENEAVICVVGVVEVVVVAYLINIAIYNSHSLHRTTTKKLRKYSNLKELRRMWQSA